jgi:alcohol dehydrogenase class IV
MSYWSCAGPASHPTRLDALSHCIASYFSPRFNPVAEANALDGTRRVWANLPPVKHRPGQHRSADGDDDGALLDKAMRPLT